MCPGSAGSPDRERKNSGAKTAHHSTTLGAMTIVPLGKIQAACTAGAVALGTVLWTGPAVSAPPQIANHRAIYEMTLASSSERSGITSVEGRMVLEFAGTSCEGYTLNSRIVTRFGNRDGKVTQTDIRSTSWESGDGKTFRFGTRQYLEDALQEETEGRATRGEGGKAGAGILTKPDEEAFELPADAVFPTEHNFRIMEAAFSGGTTDQTVVFDATDGKKYYAATTFIGGQKSPGAAKLPDGVEATATLATMRSWPVSISFFDDSQPASGEQTPSHEISFQMFENGVSIDVLLNYGDFSVKGVLSGLEIFETPKCK